MPSQLILMRHGQSVWNKLNLFTGWVDIPLSAEGIQEALEGGKKIRSLPIDVVFTSSLVRAHMTVCLSLLHHASGRIPVFHHPEGRGFEGWSRNYSGEAEQMEIPVYMAWELNERMYGKLQGCNKEETARKYGAEQVRLWRRSYDAVPPGGESLEATVQRAVPYFQTRILPCLERGENVFVAAHGNSLRGIVMHLEGLSSDEVVQLEIATGEPLVYSYERGKWKKE